MYTFLAALVEQMCVLTHSEITQPSSLNALTVFKVVFLYDNNIKSQCFIFIADSSTLTNGSGRILTLSPMAGFRSIFQIALRGGNFFFSLVHPQQKV